MSDSEKNYEGQGITVTWKKDLCIHSAKCANGLPAVFDPKRRPWIQLDQAERQEIMDVVDQCPSGALSYHSLTEKNSQIIEKEVQGTQIVQVDVIPNGPLAVKSDCTITMADGSSLNREKASYFCRCGASENKPFCDGTHKRINFVG